MDKKDEVNEKVELNRDHYDSRLMRNNSQTDDEKEILKIVKRINKDVPISKNETLNNVNTLINKSQVDIDNKDNNDNALRKNSQTINGIDSIGKKSQNNNEIDKLRKNSQTVDKANTYRNLEIQNKENSHRNIETKNKDNVINIDLHHTQSKSNGKSIYKQENNYQVKRNQIKTINKKQEFKKPDYWGHRDRLRNRFREGLLKGFTDYEVLELLLFYTINKIDTKPIAYNLINEFGSIEKVFTQTYERILSVIKQDNRPSKQECEKSAFLIKFIRNLAVLLWKRGINNRLEAKEKIIKNGAELLAYLKEQYNNYLEADMRDLSYEQFRVIFLDSRNKILKDEVMFEGTINQTGVYPRQILKRALELNATAIIAVHNHPGGTLKPSNADISVTRTLQSACDNLGISLLDHLIIGDKFCNGKDQEKSFYSFAENGLL